MDGTLWDAAEQVVDAWNQVLSSYPKLGVKLTVRDMNSNMGKTMDGLGEAFFPMLGHEERRKLLDECVNYENNYLDTHPGVLYPKVKETLKQLSKSYELYIVSNCQCGYIEALLKSHDLDGYVRDYECFGSTGLQKGDNIRMVAKRNHLDECIYVGDTAMDQAAAAAAGIPFVHAAYGYGSADKAAATLESMEQLPEIAKQLLD